MGDPPLSAESFPVEEDGDKSPRPLYFSLFFLTGLSEPTLIRNLSELCSVGFATLVVVASFLEAFLLAETLTGNVF